MTNKCEWCGAAIENIGTRGPIPRYCKPSHRRRAWEGRRSVRWPTELFIEVEEIAAKRGITVETWIVEAVEHAARAERKSEN